MHSAGFTRTLGHERRHRRDHRDRVEIRAGSCVLPLHHPAPHRGGVGARRQPFARAGRDLLRVGLAARRLRARTGRLSAHATRSSRSGIETVRALWRGEARTFRGPRARSTVRTLPRPVQPELPFWVTAAGNPETFRAAGADRSEPAHAPARAERSMSSQRRSRIYRRAWQAGGPSRPRQRDVDAPHLRRPKTRRSCARRSTARCRNYLRSATDLLKQHAASFPAFRQRRPRKHGPGVREL